MDKFKFINDIFGYEAGNATIRRIWEDIGSFVQSDEVYARQTADRFVMLLKADDMDAVIKRLEDMSEKICKKEDWKQKENVILLKKTNGGFVSK